MPSPWKLVIAVTLPFWVFVTATRVTMYFLSSARNPLVIIAPPDVRIAQHALLLPILLCCYRAALAVGWPERRRAGALALHAGLALVFALAARPLLVFPQAVHDDDFTLLQEIYRSELGPSALTALWYVSTLDFLLTYCFGLALLIGAHTYFQLKYEKLRTAKLERDWMRARLQALRMQLNPHFLFNTLNAAVALVHQRPEAAERMLIGLGELLRRALREGEAEQVTLECEAEFVRKYLELQRLRFADRLVFELDIPPPLRRALVPGLLLQPLAENAVVHGVANETDVVRINVRARRDDDNLILEVENTAAAQRVATPGTGIGLGATRERLQAMFGEDQEVELGMRAGTVVARVRIPFALAADSAEAA